MANNVNSEFNKMVKQVEDTGFLVASRTGEIVPEIVGENGVWAVATVEEGGSVFVSVHQSELDALRAAVLDRGEVKFLSWGDPWQI